MPNQDNAASEQAKSVARRLLQSWNQRKQTTIPAELMANTMVTRFATPVVATYGDHPQVQSENVFPPGAFPDQHFEEEMVIAEGDLVFIAWTMTGTHQGDLFGKAATGKKVSVTGADVIRVQNNKIAEHWNFYPKARVHALAKLGLLDQDVQKQLLTQGLLSRGMPSGINWKPAQ